jgi:methanogenic corrinoid protein MtbC1
MKHDWLDSDRAREELIAGFGGARITRDLDGKFAIKGGTAEEQQQARTWMTQFLHPKPVKKSSPR